MRASLFKYLACASVAIFSACTQGEGINEMGNATTRTETSETHLKVSEPSILDILKTYVTKVKLAHIVAKNDSRHNNTQSEYTLTPYIYKNDTVMYIAQYEKGWELLSTDERMPLVIASDELGYYKEDEMPDAMRLYILSLAEDILTTKNNLSLNHNKSSLWQAINLKNEDINSNNIKSTRMDLTPGTGYWQLISTSPLYIIDPGITVNHLLSTSWHQLSPFNNYIPTNTNHLLVGCGPVGLGQLLYYYRNTISLLPPTTATYNPYTSSYTFSGFSNVWNLMATDEDDTGTNYTAMFLGYLGNLLGTDYGSTESSTSPSSIVSLMNSYLYNTTYANIDYDYIVSRLSLGHPVLATANYAANTNEGHVFIIDKVKTRTTGMTYTYGWVGTASNGEDSNEYDGEGNIIGYTFTYEQEVTNEEIKFSMNWGDRFVYTDYNNVEFSPTDDWAVVDYHYNYQRKIFKHIN